MPLIRAVQLSFSSPSFFSAFGSVVSIFPRLPSPYVSLVVTFKKSRTILFDEGIALLADYRHDEKDLFSRV